jgi:hypothetical protein
MVTWTKVDEYTPRREPLLVTWCRGHDPEEIIVISVQWNDNGWYSHRCLYSDISQNPPTHYIKMKNVIPFPWDFSDLTQALTRKE